MPRTRDPAPRDRAPRPASRRARERRARRNERIAVYAIGGILALAVAVVLVGLYVTQYLPPRAHVLTAGERDYSAAAAARRAAYEVRAGSAASDPEAAVEDTLRALEREAILLQRAPALVGPATDWDIDTELRGRLGLEEAEGYLDADTKADLLTDAGLPLDEYNRLIGAEILRDRLDRRFRGEIGGEADQLRVSRIRLADRGGAEDARARLLEGEDFAALAGARTAEADRAEDGGDLGWLPEGSLSGAARLALAGLEPGAISEVVADGPFFDVYLVAERERARPLEEAQLDALVARRHDEWIAEQRSAVAVERGLSGGEERWILERLLAALADGNARPPLASRGAGS